MDFSREDGEGGVARCAGRSVRPPPFSLLTHSPLSPRVLTHIHSSSISFAQRVDEAIARARSCPLDRILSPLSSAAALALEDGQEWLSLDEMGFEEMLKGRGPGKGGLGDLDDEELDTSESEGEGMEGVEGEGEEERKEERKAKRAARKLEGMASKVEEFVQGRGAVDGAEFSE